MQPLPDFIIGGAMKCATTSLHYLLNKHPKIFIPDGEIHFFSIDDYRQHPDFLIAKKRKWYFPDYENNFHEYLKWYTKKFINASPEQLVGDESTTYLPSTRAVERIKSTLPQIKLIFLLRDPVDRTYSHYWHEVKSGRATLGFEQKLRQNPYNLITRSLYKEQLSRYFNLFDREKIKIILFEEFINDPQETINEVCDFLGLGSFSIRDLCQQHNKTPMPKNLNLQLTLNRIFRKQIFNLKNIKRLPYFREELDPKLPLSYRLFRKLNLSYKTKPRMDVEVKTILKQILARENEGLDKLISKNLSNLWPTFNK